MKAVYDWLDARTGWRGLLREALFERVPGGARWRYVWGSTLTFALAVQFVTGLFLWMAYSPGAQTAWASVYYIQHEMQGGWLLRGIHHFTAQSMTVLLVLHLMQVVIDGAYRAPREVNFWFGLGLLGLTLAISLTGYLLPWDQKGYWATKVATNIAAITPFVGPELQRLIVGGPDYGHHTLTRFFALHAGVLPACVVALVAGHVYLFRRHGLTPKRPLRRPDGMFWPDQVLKDAVACLAVMATVLFLSVRHRGAELFGPADPSEPFSAARPEWYFLFLFQFLKYFPGGSEIWGALVIPGIVAAVVAAMPFLGAWRLGHRFNVAFLSTLIAGAGLLTWQALRQDAADPLYAAAVRSAQAEARRAVELAKSPAGVPKDGPVYMLRSDPLTMGPRLFAHHCAACHRHGGHDGLGGTPKDPASAPDLAGFGSRAWLAGLLDPARVDGPDYFGGTAHKDGKMARFVKRKVARYDAAGQEGLKKVVAAVSAEAALPGQAAADAAEARMIEEGRALLRAEFNCADCHAFRKPDPDATACDLTGWGSREWIIGIVADPAHARFYGDKNDRMPAFGAGGRLSPAEIGLVADWLRGTWYRPAPVR